MNRRLCITTAVVVVSAVGNAHAQTSAGWTVGYGMVQLRMLDGVGLGAEVNGSMPLPLDVLGGEVGIRGHAWGAGLRGRERVVE